MSIRKLRRREFVTLLGSQVAWPLAAHARDAAKVPVIGVLWHAGSPEEEQPFFDALNRGFSDLGYIEGQNIRLEHRFPNEVPDRFKSIIAERVAMNVDVLVSIAPASNWVREANIPMPHVFVIVPDPVGQGFVSSLSHPGGNATGLSMLGIDLTKKRLQFLIDCVPPMKSLGFLAPRLAIPTATLPIIKLTQSAASELGLDFHLFDAASLTDCLGSSTRWWQPASKAYRLVRPASFTRGKPRSRLWPSHASCPLAGGPGNSWYPALSWHMAPPSPPSFDAHRPTSTKS